jgi:hypothetical protein
VADWDDAALRSSDSAHSGGPTASAHTKRDPTDSEKRLRLQVGWGEPVMTSDTVAGGPSSAQPCVEDGEGGAVDLTASEDDEQQSSEEKETSTSRDEIDDEEADEQQQQDAEEEEAPATPAGSAVSPAPHATAVKSQVINGWEPNDKSILLPGVDDEIILVLSPWESLHLHGSARLLVLAGSCSIFGAKLSAGGGARGAKPPGGSGGGGGGGVGGREWHEVHAVPPYGPMPIQAGGTALDLSVLSHSALVDRAAVALLVSAAPNAQQAAAIRKRIVEELVELASMETGAGQRQVGCVLCLARWQQQSELPPHARRTLAASATSGQVAWVKGRRGLDALFRKTLEGARVVLPSSNLVTLQAMSVPNDWLAAGDRIVSLASGAGGARGNPLVAACVGPKGSGKSSLMRYLINRLLARHAVVYLLDADVGQAEMTPGGLVSLTAIRRPLLGPPSTHLAIDLHGSRGGGRGGWQMRGEEMREDAETADAVQQAPHHGQPPAARPGQHLDARAAAHRTGGLHNQVVYAALMVS